LRSAAEYRLQERKIAEAWCEASHIPSRTEMDEMQRTVTELKRQLRELQRAKSVQPTAAAEKPKRAAAARKPKRAAAAGQAERTAAPRRPPPSTKTSSTRSSNRRSTRA